MDDSRKVKYIQNKEKLLSKDCIKYWYNQKMNEFNLQEI